MWDNRPVIYLLALNTVTAISSQFNIFGYHFGSDEIFVYLEAVVGCVNRQKALGVWRDDPQRKGAWVQGHKAIMHSLHFLKSDMSKTDWRLGVPFTVYYLSQSLLFGDFFIFAYLF